MFKTVRDNTKGKSLNLRLGFVGCVPIGENARQVNDLCKPTTVFLFFNFQSELHGVKLILRFSHGLEKSRYCTGSVSGLLQTICERVRR